MKYQIGEVAKLFGLTKGGIRYLEERGVIQPKRDEKNGYRYFDRRQITDLKHVRLYQSIGFTLDEAVELMHNGDPDLVLLSIERKERELTAQIEQAHRMICQLKKHAGKVSSAGCQGSLWALADRPAMYRISVTEDIRANSGNAGQNPDPDVDRERKAAETAFISCFPETALSLLVRKHDDGYHVARGSCIEEEAAKRLGLPLNGQVDYYPKRDGCYYSILMSMDGMRGLDEIYKQIDAMERKGERLSGDIIGRMLHRRSVGNDVVVHHEFWIPFERA